MRLKEPAGRFGLVCREAENSMKKIILYFLLFSFYFLLFTIPAFALPTPTPRCDQLPGGPLTDPYCALLELAVLISIFLKYGAVFGVVISILVLLLGAFKFITAGDNPKTAEAARKTLTWAIIGLVVTTSTYGILTLISNAIPGLSERIGIPTPAPPP